MSSGDAAEAETQTNPLWPIILFDLCWKRRTRHPNFPSFSEAALNVLFRGLVTKPLSFSLYVKSQNKFRFFTHTCAIEKKLFKSDYLQDHSMRHGTNFWQRLGPGQVKEQFRWVTALNCPQKQEGDMATRQGQWKNYSSGRAALFGQCVCMNPNTHGHYWAVRGLWAIPIMCVCWWMMFSTLHLCGSKECGDKKGWNGFNARVFPLIYFSLYNAAIIVQNPVKCLLGRWNFST